MRTDDYTLWLLTAIANGKLWPGHEVSAAMIAKGANKDHELPEVQNACKDALRYGHHMQVLLLCLGGGYLVTHEGQSRAAILLQSQAGTIEMDGAEFTSEQEELECLRALREYNDLALKVENDALAWRLHYADDMKWQCMRRHTVNGFHWAQLVGTEGFIDEISTPARLTREEMEQDIHCLQALFGTLENAQTIGESPCDGQAPSTA